MDAVSQFVPGIGPFLPTPDLSRRKRRRPPDVQQPRERKFEEFSSVQTEVSMEAPRSNQHQRWMSFICCSSDGRETWGNGSSFLENNGDCHTVLALLKDCTVKKDVGKGTKIHMDIVKSGLLETSPYLASSLISMYSKCGVFVEAHKVFNKMPIRDLVTWTALIGGLTEYGHADEALVCFDAMQLDG